jgi:hypothetical protein
MQIKNGGNKNKMKNLFNIISLTTCIIAMLYILNGCIDQYLFGF